MAIYFEGRIEEFMWQMSKTIKAEIIIGVLVQAALGFTGCSKSGDTVKLGFTIAGESSSSSSSSDGAAQLAGKIAPFAPSAVSKFDCIFVNIMGDGIGDWTNNKSTVSPSGGCGYYGALSGMVALNAGGSTSVDVPSGTARIIQVLGVRLGAGKKECPSSFVASDLSNLDSYPGIFELGRTIQDTLQDNVITVKNAYVAAAAKDFRCFMKDKVAKVDKVAPTPGAISASVDATTVVLSWASATDNATSPENLQYKVVRGASVSALKSINQAEAATVVKDWAENLTSMTISEGTSYAYAVLVRDAAQNEALYSAVWAEPGDTTAPTVGAAISATTTASSVTLSWGAATDDITSASSLKYKVVQANTTAALNNVVAANNATVVTDWTANLTSATISGLTVNTSYAFAVLVKDEADNKALYSPVLATTSGAPTLSYSGATGTTVKKGSAMSVSPTTLNTNGSAITGCAIKSGTTALPLTLSVNTTTCVISGTPSASLAATTYTLVATNAVGTSSDATVTLTVTDVPTLSYAGASGTSGSVGSAMSVSPTTLNSNQAAVTACGVKSGTTALPSGLSVSATTCVISGTPTTSVSGVTYTLVATNSAGNSADATVTLTIVIPCSASLFNGGSGTSGDPYQVSTRTQLANIQYCTSSTAYFKQSNDIDLGGSSTPWTSVSLAGNYDGDNRAVTGLYISSSSNGANIGLFSTVGSSGSVKNLNLTSVSVTGAGMTGALAGTSSGVITNCASSGSVTLNYSSGSDYYVGGLIGKMAAGSVSSSHSSATATVAAAVNNATSGAGGLVGNMASGTSITDSYATGAVSELLTTSNAASMNMGGLVGIGTSGTVSSSYSTGNVSADFNGSVNMGMIGSASSMTVSKCFSKGTYSSPGFIRYTIRGGIIGYMSGGSISKSYAMITTVGTPVNGGVTGGLVGANLGGATITASYAAPYSLSSFSPGNLEGFSGGSNAFAVVGSGSQAPVAASGISGCYVSDAYSDFNTGVTSLSTTNMEAEDEFSGFDFTDDWVMPTANTFTPFGTPLLSPVLRWQCGSNGITCP